MRTHFHISKTFIKDDSGIYEYSDEEVFEGGNNGVIQASHPDWLPAWQPQGLQFISKNKIMRISNNDIAVVEKFTDEELVLKWYAYGTERFRKDENGVYRFQRN